MDPGLLAAAVIVFLLVGAVAGFLTGLLGIGGGVVMVPSIFLYLSGRGYSPDLAVHVAVGTSLATMLFSTGSSLLAHARLGSIDYAIIRHWGPWVVLGVAGSLAAAGLIDGTVIAWVLASFLLIISVYLGVAGRPGRDTRVRLPALLQPVIGLGIGGLSAFLGIGGAMLSVPGMLVSGIPVHRAIGTAPAFGLLIALFGAIGSVFIGWDAEGLPPLSLGYVSLLGVAVIAPSSFLLAPVGAKCVQRLPTDRLQTLFAVILFLVACRLFYELAAGGGP